MKKITKILAVCCVLFFTNVSAQMISENYERNFKFGVGINTGVPLSKPYSFNVGGDFRVQYNISETYSISFTTGYNRLFVKDNEPSIGYIPVKVGYKSFIFNNEFYVMSEIGGAFSTTKSFKQNSILFSPSIGYATQNIDISVKYEFLKDFPVIKDNLEKDGLGQFVVRVAYGFDL